MCRAHFKAGRGHIFSFTYFSLILHTFISYKISYKIKPICSRLVQGNFHGFTSGMVYIEDYKYGRFVPASYIEISMDLSDMVEIEDYE